MQVQQQQQQQRQWWVGCIVLQWPAGASLVTGILPQQEQQQQQQGAAADTRSLWLYGLCAAPTVALAIGQVLCKHGSH
jgi:hypothetical protein